MEKKALAFSPFFENAEQNYHLATKVEKGVSWEALGAPWGGLGRPLGPKTTSEPTF